MNNLAVITARSGSKGLKDKNIKMLGDRPLLAYSIEAALDSGMFNTVFVSTDSEQYAQIARQYGADVPFLRSEEIAGDHASSWDAVREAVGQYEKLGQRFDTIALLQPTSPLRSADDIVKGYQLFAEKEADYVIGVCRTEHSPLWCNTLPEDMSMDGFISKEIDSKPRQELPDYYRINGALYIVRVSALDGVDDMYHQGCYAYVMPPERSIDIDTSFDFKVAELFMARTENSENRGEGT